MSEEDEFVRLNQLDCATEFEFRIVALEVGQPQRTQSYGGVVVELVGSCETLSIHLDGESEKRGALPRLLPVPILILFQKLLRLAQFVQQGLVFIRL